LRVLRAAALLSALVADGSSRRYRAAVPVLLLPAAVRCRRRNGWLQRMRDAEGLSLPGRHPRSFVWEFNPRPTRVGELAKYLTERENVSFYSALEFFWSLNA